MISTKEEFLAEAQKVIDDYPALALKWRAGDSEVRQELGAIAQMFTLLSRQIGLAETEPWTKARDVMVLADAAARGILPYGKAAKWKINVINNASSSNSITVGRRLLDRQSKVWVVTSGAVVAAGATGSIVAQQLEQREYLHTVTTAQNFYRIPIQKPEDGKYLAGIELYRNSDNQKFTFFERYNNVDPGDFVYQIASDENKDVWIEMGVADIGGYVPAQGEVFKVVLIETFGEAQIPAATPFTFENVNVAAVDEKTELLADSMHAQGAAPLSVEDLRELCGFQSMYDEDSVYLGNFHFLLMRKMAPFVFLSVWNEQIEESVRGANVANINKLFVSYVKSGQAAAAVEADVKEYVRIADDSYRVVFVPVVEKPIPMSIAFRLSPVHDEVLVKNNAKDLMLKTYGRDSVWARRGRARINWRATAELLRQNIPELQDGVSDVSVTVTEVEAQVKPEEFRYVSAASITTTNAKLILY